MSLTEELVVYATDVRYEDIPKKVIDRAKLHILDAIGCALGGSVTILGKTVIRMLEESCDKQESTVIGVGKRTVSKDAAFINATLANALDYGDHGDGHPAATVIPSALAVGEKVNASGMNFIAAVVAAYEVIVRVNRYKQFSAERARKMWGHNHQAFGGAVAAGKLLGLDYTQMLNAFGYAGAASPLPSAMKWGFDNRPLTWMKDSVAQSALAGVMGAFLAKYGFLACRDILDGELGFWLMAGSDRCSFEALTRNLGEEYAIMSGGFKPWPCCRSTHAPLTALSQVINEHKIRAEEIKEINIKSFWYLTNFFQCFNPKEIVDAEFSIPYVVTMVVMRIPLGPKWYENKLFQDPKVLEFMRRVHTETDPEAERMRYLDKDSKMIATVEVTTFDGRQLSAYTDQPKGNLQNPMTTDELKRKFRNLASYVLDDTKIDKIIEIVDNLEKLDNINELTKLLY